MAGKKKVPKKKASAKTKLICIVHYASQRTDKQTRRLSVTSFEKIKETVRLRLACENENVKLESVCAQVPVELIRDVHGAHRKCYQMFTNIGHIKSRKRQHTADNDESMPSTSKRQKSSSSAVLFPSQECLFCGRNRIQSKGRSEYLTKCVTETAAVAIQCSAEEKNDFELLGKIKDVDLCAREAHYHNSCRRDYTRKDDRNLNADVDDELVENYSAHCDAFDHIREHVEEHIIHKGNVERTTLLKEKYLNYLQAHHPSAYNPDYKAYKLKAKLQKHFGSRVKFWHPNNRSELIYSDTLPIGQTLEAFEVAASEEKFLEEAAIILRRRLLDAKKSAYVTPWPPTATQLLSPENKPPAFLQDFLSHLIGGKQHEKISGKFQRIVDSCAQDICYAITKGEWKMAKHVLLGMTLRHMTGSAELITLLNRLGHCQSYSQVMELDTALCNQLISVESLLPTTVSVNNNSVLHFSWDNFDMSEETPSGAGTTHVAHGIVVQEVTENTNSENGSLPQQNHKSSKSRSIVYEDKELPPCFVKGKKEPNLVVDTVNVKLPSSVELSKQADFAWAIARQHMSNEQSVPGWTGWVSLTGKSEENADCHRKSTVDYMVPIHKPITENATVQQVLRLCQQATKDVNQEVTIITFDLAVVMKAYSIIWQNPEEFQNILVRIGVFHTICSYLGVLGKMMSGSGFEDIIIEAGICASGSIDQVLRGKHYNRAMRVHKLMYEALEHILLHSFFYKKHNR